MFESCPQAVKRPTQTCANCYRNVTDVPKCDCVFDVTCVGSFRITNNASHVHHHERKTPLPLNKSEPQKCWLLHAFVAVDLISFVCLCLFVLCVVYIVYNVHANFKPTKDNERNCNRIRLSSYEMKSWWRIMIQFWRTSRSCHPTARIYANKTLKPYVDARTPHQLTEKQHWRHWYDKDNLL